MAEPDELTLTIAQRLEIDAQYIESVEAWDAERIAQVRSAGRKAGRMLGWKIATQQTEPSDEGRVTVIVVVREWPDEEMRKRLMDRGRLLMSKFWSEILPPRPGPSECGHAESGDRGEAGIRRAPGRLVAVLSATGSDPDVRSREPDPPRPRPRPSRRSCSR
jgi:hypothetical protein